MPDDTRRGRSIEIIGEFRTSAQAAMRYVQPAEPGSGSWVDLLVHRVVRFAFDGLAGGEAEGLGAGSPPPAGWFPGLGGVEVVPAGTALGCAVLGFQM